MYIKSLSIKNFKAFEELSINFNEKTNIIIGDNNIGKSSVFEALLLWKKCFDLLIRPNQTEFYKLDTSGRYIPFVDLHFVRLTCDTDLFHVSPNIAKIAVEIDVDRQVYPLAFELSKPASIKNSYLRYKTINNRNFVLFAEAMKQAKVKLSDVMAVYRANPVSNLLENEPYMNRGQVLRKIALGKSGEVLRNKIVSRSEVGIHEIEKHISNVMKCDVHFSAENKAMKDNEEYINLKVTFGQSKSLDIHLQGSGFLQIAEIFSTLDFFKRSAINLLLIDEPDSHIHVKLQKALLNEIRTLPNAQCVIISHNDAFVSSSNQGDLFYLNKEAKESHRLEKLELEDFDLAKLELGGIIATLDALNDTNIIGLTEGSDDYDYINHLACKYAQITGKKISTRPCFFYLRGKGDLKNKVDYYIRLLSQVKKNVNYAIIFDKDFCTLEGVKQHIGQILHHQTSFIYHDGYCIESTVFSNLDVLISFLLKRINQPEPDLRTYVENYTNNLRNNILDVTSQYYISLEQKFNSQKTAQRPELENISFADFVRCAVGDVFRPQDLFNKSQISDFIKRIYQDFGEKVIEFQDTDSDDTIASNFFNCYIESLSSEIDLADSLKSMLNILYDFV